MIMEMLKGLLYFNDKDAYTQYGVFLTENRCDEHTNIDALLAAPAMKPYLSVSFRELDGEKLPAVLPVPRFEARDMTLYFCLCVETAEDYQNRYAAFVSLLKSGRLSIRVPNLNRTYKVYYKELSGYEQLSETTARFKVKFREPEPGL